jgi:glycosyltransferase involved in cell wall biosynthesis
VRVLYLCPDLGVPVLGHKGASVHVRSLVTALAALGHDVVLAAAALTASPWESPAPLEAPVVHLPPSEATLDAVLAVRDLRDAVGATSELPAELRRILYDRDLARELRLRFMRQRLDAIYERASLYATAGAGLARALDVPHVVELNAPLALEHRTYRGAGVDDLPAAAEARLLRAADAVVAVSEPLREHALRVGADPGRVTVRANGVDHERFHPGARDPRLRAALGLDGGPVVGFVGGLRGWHGVDVLPDLLGRLRERIADVRLLIVGNGPLAGPLEEELGRRGLRHRAVLTGAVAHDRVPALVRELDVALAPYPPLAHDFYFSPLKLLEYMACGVPVVASAVGAIPELVEDGITGLVVPPGDVEALAGACARLLEDPALGARLGAAGAAVVGERHGWDAVARETADQFAELQAARAGAAA